MYGKKMPKGKKMMDIWERRNNMCTTCGCNYPNVDHAMANAMGDNPMGMPIAPKPSSIVKATPKKPKK